ncbi:MAG: TaqI-like C-terminal specificity domain-containing protein, partial [Marinifilaceae bacterium]|nr:TaqI-like C-terminal specificity domain-containing protein [Marinifilaceae bacterium]
LVNKSCYIILSNNNNVYFLKYLLGILSSTLIGYYVQNIGDKSKQRLFPRITMSTLKNIPIKIDTYIMEKVVNIVDECLYQKKQNIKNDIINKEIKLDILIYHLYGLTYDEVLIVDPQTPITPEEYERAKLE